jgi:hypothetical protein
MSNKIPYLVLLLALGAGCEQQGASLPMGMNSAPCECTPSDGNACPIYQKAQICPDLSPVQFCSRFVGTSYGTDLLLSNRGYEGLRIESVQLLGDDGCAFDPPQLSFVPGSGKAIERTKDESIRLVYRPRKIGPDHAVLRIISNAENFERLDIAICGQGIMAGMPGGPDGGACLQCMKPASDKPACGGPDGGT